MPQSTEILPIITIGSPISATSPAIQPAELIRPNGRQSEAWFRRIGLFRKAADGISRRTFEGHLAKLVNSALAHEQEKLKPGADAYRRLYRMADELLAAYCSKQGCDRMDLEAQIPAVAKLRNLAQPEPGSIPIYLRPSTLIALVLVSVMTAAVLGTDQGVFFAARHLVQVVTHY